MRAIEVERNQILIEINQLKNEQNSTLELLVEKRTKELSDVNIELVNQKDVLHQRNERIELLLRELHHRVKNNLQLISSFYDLRLEDPVKKDLSSIISEGKNRIGVMALVHNMLYHGNDLTVIDTCSFIHQITAHLETFFNKDQLIETQIICSNLKFDMDTALPLGLIINELLTNTYKHTNFYTERKMVQITIEPTQKHSYKLTISDNGMEIKKKIEPKKTRSFGLQMIYLLSKQLNGSFDYHHDGKNNFIVNFMDTEGRRQIE
jgi:two-component sensor histidine kinase